MKKLTSILMALLCSTTIVSAGIEEWQNSLNGAEIATESVLSIYDQYYDHPLYGDYSGDFDMVQQDIELRLRWDDTDMNRVWPGNWSVEVKYDLLLERVSGDPINLENQSIKINHTDGGSFVDLIHQSFTNHDFIHAELTIVDVVVIGAGTYAFVPNTGNQTLPSDIWLDLVIISDKHFYLDNASPIVMTKHDVIEGQNKLDLAWAHVDGAEWYELEWLFYDAGTLSLVQMNQDDLNHEYDFKNAVRVRIREHFYTIPLTFPNGYIAWRVRPVGYFSGDSKLNTGGWNFPVASETGYIENIDQYSDFGFYWQGMELDKNWQYQATFAEDGRKAETIQFADGSLRPRQQSNYSPEEKLAIVQSSMVDYFGRSTVNVLPVPLIDQGYVFYENMLLTADGFYDYRRFDMKSESSLEDPANNFIQPEPFLQTSSNPGAGFYYSAANTDPFGMNGKLTPDAQGFPFSRTILSNDGSGRVLQQSGVGEVFRLGRSQNDEHVTKYHYGNPTGQEELDRLFGNEVGFVSQYKKTVMFDPNGQASVTYTDQAGRTIATALAGENPDNVLPIDGCADANGNIYSDEMSVDLTAFNQPINAGSHVLNLSHTLVVSTPFEGSGGNMSNYHFTYGLTPEGMIEESCKCVESEVETPIATNSTPSPMACPDCKYNLVFYVYDNENQTIVFPESGSVNGDVGFGNYLTNGVFTISNFSDLNADFDYALNIGSYTVHKTLTLANAQEVYDQFIAHNTITDENGSCTGPNPVAVDCPSCASDCASNYSIVIDGEKYYYHANGEWIIANRIGNAYDNVAEYYMLDDFSNVPSNELIGQMMSWDDVEEHFQNLIDDCILNCDLDIAVIPDFCMAYREALLNDLKPGGQYFDNTPDAITDNNGAWIPSNIDQNGDGLVGINGWLDENIVPPTNQSSSFYQAFGDYIDTWQMDWPMIRQDWQTIYSDQDAYTQNEFEHIWIQYHPEYCIYERNCQLKDGSGEIYDYIKNDMESVIFDPAEISLDRYHFQEQLALAYQSNPNLEDAFFNPLNAPVENALNFNLLSPQDTYMPSASFDGTQSDEFVLNHYDLWVLDPSLADMGCSGTTVPYPIMHQLQHYLAVEEMVGNVSVPKTIAGVQVYWSIWYVMHLATLPASGGGYSWQDVLNAPDWANLGTNTKNQLIGLRHAFSGDIGNPEYPLTPIQFFGGIYQFHRETYLENYSEHDCSSTDVLCGCCKLPDKDADANTYSIQGFDIRFPVNPLVDLVVEDFQSTPSADQPTYMIDDVLITDYIDAQNQGMGSGQQFASVNCTAKAAEMVTALFAEHEDCLEQLKAGTGPVSYSEVYQAAIGIATSNCDAVDPLHPGANVTVILGGENFSYNSVETLMDDFLDTDCSLGAFFETYQELNLGPERIACGCNALGALLSTNNLTWTQILADYPEGQFDQLVNALINLEPNDNFDATTGGLVNLTTIYNWMGWCALSDNNGDGVVNEYGYSLAGMYDQLDGLPASLDCGDEFDDAKCSCHLIEAVLNSLEDEHQVEDNYDWIAATGATTWSYFHLRLQELQLAGEPNVSISDVVQWRNLCQSNWLPNSNLTLVNLPSALQCSSAINNELLNQPDCNENDPNNLAFAQILAQETFVAEQARLLLLHQQALAYQQSFIQKCFDNLQSRENFRVDYNQSEYYYTLYYYDQAGNLIKTVPPAGVRILDDVALAACADHRANPELPFVHTNHHLVSNYWYDTFNKLVRQNTPDGGTSKFWYDELGRIVASQNAEQKEDTRCSYTLYDALGRPYEAGEVQYATSDPSADDQEVYHINYSQFNQIDLIGSPYLDWLGAITFRDQVTRTWYDEAMVNDDLSGEFDGGQQHLRNRVSAVAYAERWNASSNFVLGYVSASHYSYDVHGNVDHLVQENRMLEGLDQAFKHMTYRYDQLSGKVYEVKYQEGQWDEWYHRYAYDNNNRLKEVFTSTNGRLWERDAKYHYSALGPLARMETGRHQVQGTDYAYTLNGWIKAVNSNSLTSSHDIGKDGLANNGAGNGSFAGDVFSYSLTYFNNAGNRDYTAIGTSPVMDFLSEENNTALNAQSPGLYNGNISRMAVNYLPTAIDPIAAQQKGFKYDQLHRIKESYTQDYENLATTNTFADMPLSNAYRTSYSYDLNGNIVSLNRRNGEGILFDRLGYNYLQVSDIANGTVDNYQISAHLHNDASLTAGYHFTNRLGGVNDAGSISAAVTDIEDQDDFNYTYDEIGQLTSDANEGIESIVWSVSGKVLNVRRIEGSTKPDLLFKYDALGQRIAKIVIPRTAAGPEPQSEWMYTIYVRDAQGNVMATYSRFFETCGTIDWRDKLQLNEQYIYGSARVGMLNRSAYVSKCFTTGDHMSAQDGYQAFGSTSYVVSTLVYSHEMSSNDILPYEKSVIFVSRKTYEFSDHLGNVSATISDRKITIAIGAGNAVASYTPEVLSQQDYFPFGMGMMGRSVTAEGYRYGFNGQEKETEITGSESHTSAQYWMYDSRLGRRWNVDPKGQTSLSFYASLANSPLRFIDPLGDTIIVTTGEGEYLFTLNNGQTKIETWTARAIYDSGFQWFEPLADNYMPLIEKAEDLATNDALLHFTWFEIATFAQEDRLMASYRQEGAGDWKTSEDGANGFFLVTVNGYPYWADAVGQIPFAVDYYTDVYLDNGDKRSSSAMTLDKAREHGDGSIIGERDDSNGYDIYFVARALRWSMERFELKIEEGVFFDTNTLQYNPISPDLLEKEVSNTEAENLNINQ